MTYSIQSAVHDMDDADTTKARRERWIVSFGLMMTSFHFLMQVEMDMEMRVEMKMRNGNGNVRIDIEMEIIMQFPF